MVRNNSKLIEFKYVALRDGVEYTGSVKAKDRFEVYKKVRDEGGEIVKVKKISGFSFESIKALNERFSTIKETDIILFARNLSAMLGAGLSLTRALEVAQKQSKNPRLRYVVRDVLEFVRTGGALSDALKKHKRVFNDLFVSMVRAGEESGNLPESFASIALQMDKNYKLKKRIKGAMVYPGIVLSAMVLIGYLMMTQVVPTLKKTFNDIGVELPDSTKAIIGISDFLVQNMILSIFIVAFFALVLIYFMKTYLGKRIFHALVLKIPVIGTITKEVNAARFARTLGSLLGSGVDIVTSLQITEQVVKNIYHRAVIMHAAKAVRSGEKISAIFSERADLYPAMIGEMLAVGEETGQMSKMLQEVASFYENEVDQKTKDMSTIIEPFLMLVIGGFVGFFAMAMISPIYSLSDSI